MKALVLETVKFEGRVKKEDVGEVETRIEEWRVDCGVIFDGDSR